MKSIKLLWLFILPLCLSLSSCSEDPEPDPVAEASGTYNYKTKFYLLDGSTLEYLGKDLDESGTAIMTKTATGFEVKEGGDLVFKGTKVARASNGFTFDIESQEVEIDGDDVLVEGYDGAVLSGVKYNGLYISATKTLTGYFKFDAIIEVSGVNYEVTLVIEFEATRA